MRGLRDAVAFLTRVPGGAARPDLARSVPWFPVVGLAIGAAVGGVYVAAAYVLPALVAAGLAVLAGVLATGALHEDALADTADALGARGPADALRIMKDPVHGTYGIVALVLSLLLRTGAVSGLHVTALGVLPAAHALSRGAAVVLLGTVRPANFGGLGASYAAAVSRRRAAVTGVVAVVLATAAGGPWTLAGVAAVALVTFAAGRFALRRFGGLTGDVAGAVQQLTELVILVPAAALVATGHTTWW
ncbi:MAG: adenosylcobinamide-GDP ribazoletransferase [Streptosporangiales bacterium]|nr:adenosylcobinamide-GDP ribazoletransferase [Streptosporangiales bacterium]MBO0891545.1 adenosylcobinamide-GDP ribazoletransferase [Acidothermales bacterium]